MSYRQSISNFFTNKWRWLKANTVRLVTLAILAVVIWVLVTFATAWELVMANAIFIPILAILLLVVWLLTIYIIQKLGERDLFFTTIQQGTTAFIMASGSLLEFWVNIGGYKKSKNEDVDGHRWVIPEPSEEKALEVFFETTMSGTKGLQKWLWKQYGVRYVSIWPAISKLHFSVDRRRMLEGSQAAGLPLEQRVIVSEKQDQLVPGLLAIAPRPVFVPGVELAGDNSKVNLLLLCMYQQVIPALSVLYLRGNFFPLLDAAISAAMVNMGATHQVAVYKKKDVEAGAEAGDFVGDYCPKTPEEEEEFKEQYGVDFKEKCKPAYLTYSHWLRLAQAGPRSAIERHLRNLNFSPEFYWELRGNGDTSLRPELTDFIDNATNKAYVRNPDEPLRGTSPRQHIPGGIVQRFGFMLKSVRLVDRAPHESTIELAKALLEKQTNFHTAEGVRAEAAGKRDQLKLIATGEQARFKNLINPLIKAGVNPDLAADVVKTMLRTENIGDSNITTYVEGGGHTNPSILVNPDQNRPGASTTAPSPNPNNGGQ